MDSVSWGKQTSRNFKEIILDCAEDVEGFTTHEDLFLFDATDPATFEEFYNTLPWSVRKTLSIYTLGEEDLSLPINIKFDRDCLKPDKSKLDFHSELSQDELQAVKQTLIEICNMVSAEFMGVTDEGEYIIKNQEFESLTTFLIAVVSTRLGGVKMKYIAPSDESENSYRLYFEKSQEDDPVLNRFIFIRSSSSFTCPKCREESIKSTSEGADETTFCCLNCGLAANVDYMDLANEFEPDTPNHIIQEECEQLLEDAYKDKDRISILSDLELIGSSEGSIVYEDISVYGYTEEDTELWFKRENSPVVIYHLEKQEFLDEHMQMGEDIICNFCNAKSDTNRVAGAYYEEGVGIHEKDIEICDECKEDVLSELRNIISESDKSSEYLQKIM